MSIPRKILAILFGVILMLTIAINAYGNETSFSVVLPSDLVLIDAEAFERTNLENVKVAYGTKRIESRAFANSSIRLVHLPSTIEYIADDAFLNCNDVFLKVKKDSYSHTWAVEHSVPYTTFEAVGETVLSVAFSQPITNPEAQALQRISDSLYEATEGRYSLEIFPDSSLGDQAQILEMVLLGNLDMAVVGNAIIEPYSSDFSMLSAPYVFDSMDHQKSVFSSNEPELQALYDTMQEHGMTVLSSYCLGSRNIYTSRRAVSTPEELFGMKIRVMDSENCLNMVSAMGGVGVVMSMGDVYPALQMGVVDGSENTLIAYMDLVQYEVAPFYNLTNHLMIPDHLVISNDTLSRMSAEDQATLKRICRESVVYSYDIVAAMEAGYQSRAESMGVTFVTADMSAFKASCQGVTQAAAGKSGVTQNLYDYIVSMGGDIPTGHSHSFTEWAGDQPTVCTDPVTQTRTCTGCGYVQTRTITGAHVYSDWVLTNTTNEYKEYTRTCSRCGETETKQERIVAVGETVLSVAFSQPITNPEAQALKRISDSLYEATEGRYSLQIYPDSSLGGQAQTLENVKIGALDMAVVGNAIIEPYSSDFSLLSTPYLFDSMDHQRSVFTSNASELQALYDTTQEHGMTVLSSYCLGSRNIYTSKRSVSTPEELAGMKIRVMGSDTCLNMMNAMGGVGVAMAMGDVYSAIQTDTIDGSENTLIAYVDLVQYEVAPYYNLTNHLMIPDHLVISNYSLLRMSAEDQATLKRICRESIAYSYNRVAALEEDYRSRAENNGVTFVQADIPAFKAACQSLIENEAGKSNVASALYNMIISYIQ